METTTTDIRCYRASRVQIRPLTAADRERLAKEFSHLSEQTRRRRFGGLASRLGERDLDRLTAIDHHTHKALAAIEPGTGRILGVARYIALPDVPGAAEVEVEVDDAWQRCGIGRRLICELASRARAAGFTRARRSASTGYLTNLGGGLSPAARRCWGTGDGPAACIRARFRDCWRTSVRTISPSWAGSRTPVLASRLATAARAGTASRCGRSRSIRGQRDAGYD